MCFSLNYVILVHERACNEKFPNCIKTGGSCVSGNKAKFNCECPSFISYVKDTGCKSKCNLL